MTQEDQGIVNKTKVSDWIPLLETVEKLVTQIGKNEDLSKSIGDLIIALKPYERYQYGKVIYLLSQKHQTSEQLILKPSVLDGLDLETLSFDRLKIIISGEDLSKNELLLLANKTLKMPIGTLKKLKKEIIKQKILSVVQNSEKLDTIARQAGGRD